MRPDDSGHLVVGLALDSGWVVGLFAGRPTWSCLSLSSLFVHT